MGGAYDKAKEYHRLHGSRRVRKDISKQTARRTYNELLQMQISGNAAGCMMARLLLDDSGYGELHNWITAEPENDGMGEEERRTWYECWGSAFKSILRDASARGEGVLNSVAVRLDHELEVAPKDDSSYQMMVYAMDVLLNMDGVVKDHSAPQRAMSVDATVGFERNDGGARSEEQDHDEIVTSQQEGSAAPLANAREINQRHSLDYVVHRWDYDAGFFDEVLDAIEQWFSDKVKLMRGDEVPMPISASPGAFQDAQRRYDDTESHRSAQQDLEAWDSPSAVFKYESDGSLTFESDAYFISATS